MTQQRAIETLSHNIANANTPGYSRQTTTIVASTPISSAGRAGMLGTGAATASIDRQRNGFLDLQYRNENTKLGEHEMVANTIAQVEGVFAEPSESGLRMMTERFWTSLHDLSLNPESIAARGSVSETGAALATSLNAVQQNLKGVRDDLNMRINNSVTDANILANQISGLNSQIANITTLGQQPNDLKDQRDLALDKLSRLMDVKVKESNDGSIKVTVAGRVLVEGSVAVPLTTQQNGGGDGYVDILASGVPIQAGEIQGELKGLLDLRDGILSDDHPDSIMYKLNHLATGLAGAVNAQHRLGYDLNGSAGEDFFTSRAGAVIDASSIQVNPHFQNGVLGLNKIAAASSSTAGQGDNTNILALIAIKNKAVMSGGKSTLDDYYKESITSLGIRGQAAGRMVTNQQNLLDFVSGQRESTSGISMDEEMSDLIRYQHAYNASARVLSIMDTLLQGIIQGR